MGNQNKSGVLTTEEAAIYDRIKANIPLQKENYAKWEKELPQSYKNTTQSKLEALGVRVDWSSGHVSYMPGFQPIETPYDICYIRHGKTLGNTEPRVYQGQVDYPSNQLTDLGREQAQEACHRLESEHWAPDLIVLSPLKRAIETAKPYVDKHPEIPTKILQCTAEQAFGSWDNERVIDLPVDSICHLFYLAQNACVKSDAPHILPDGRSIEPENFCDMILRMVVAVKQIGNLEEISRIKDRRPRVVLYGHSMAGAALSVLCGKGKSSPEGFLGFDGSYIMPNASPTHLISSQ